MLAELKRAEVDRLAVCRTARWRRWCVCLDVRKVSVHRPGRCDGEGAGKRGGEEGKRTRGAWEWGRAGSDVAVNISHNLQPVVIITKQTTNEYILPEWFSLLRLLFKL